MARPTPARIAATLVTLTALGLVWWPVASTPQASRALALGVFTIGLWATGALPEFLTALAFFAIATLFAVVPPEVVFTGFSSAAMWLILGGLIVGVAVRRTGLGSRIANGLGGLFGSTYTGIIAGTVAVGLVLAFLMPSSLGRLVLLMPICIALAERFGFAPGSPGRTGVVLAAALGSYLPAFGILPANVPNLILAGAGEALYGFSPVYGQYLLLHFPVLGLLKAVLIVGLIVWLYPDRPRAFQGEQAPAGAMSAAEWRLTGILLLALALWVTDFLHHISPGWVALAAGVLCLLPLVGAVSVTAFNQDINFAPFFYVAGVLGLGAMIRHSGLGGHIAGVLLHVLPLALDAPLRNLAALSATAAAMGLLTTLPGVPAIMTPLAGEIAHASGLALPAVLMSQVLGFSTVFLPYQAPPLIVAMQLGGVSLGATTKVCLAMALLTVVVLLPLDLLWWRLLGWI